MTLRTALLVTLLAAAGCFRDHAPGVEELNIDDGCVDCHEAEYLATTAPAHGTVSPQPYPRSCQDCHRTTAWQPALGGLHPTTPHEAGKADSFFGIATGPHGGVTCLECHDLDLAAPSTAGANTNCIGCHTGEHDRARAVDDHAGIPEFRWKQSVPNFCLQCHPYGQADGHDSDNPFNIESGNHKNIRCGDCHTDGPGERDKEDVSCIGCHEHDSRTKYQEEHNEPWEPDRPNFCADSGCHPDGRKHDD